MRKLRAWLAPFARTPLHPQWLVRSRGVTLSHIAAVARGVVLDVGSADQWAQRALPGGCVYYALDHPAAGGYDSKPDVFGDALSLPFRSESIDTVLLLEVLEHLPDPDRALGEIARVLHPSGRLVLSVPFLYPIHDAPFDFQRYTEFGLRNVLKRAGLVVLELQPASKAIEAAGLTACLALAGAGTGALEKRGLALAALPLIAMLVVIVNITSWALARILPDWRSATGGYDVVAGRT